jgi:hypothetical protein
MNKKLGGAFLAMTAPALVAALLIGPSASAATTTAAASAQANPLRVQARVATSRPRDRSTEYIEVTTAKGAKVTAVAHFRSGPQTRTIARHRHDRLRRGQRHSRLPGGRHGDRHVRPQPRRYRHLFHPAAIIVSRFRSFSYR